MHKFICPNCNSKHLKSTLNVSPSNDGAGPWDHVHEMDRCGSCDNTVPTHLSRRLNMTIEQAQKQYKADTNKINLIYQL